MDRPGTSSCRSPRRELQGPRPPPLKVRKDSHKIRKPPIAPPAAAGPPPHPAHAPPVIIYTVSPKIIHANPNEFMSVVQRLTGPNSNSPSAFQESSSGAISPAARFATIERTNSPDGRRAQFFGQSMEMVDDFEIDQIGSTDNNVQRTGNFPGILSPNPNSLPPIPPSFFSPPDNYNINYSFNNNQSGFFHDLSPVLHSNRNYFENNNFMLQSPSNNFISPHINMPSPNTLDLFHTLFDL
ncbi:hypothetical protein CASFOL_016108 [Castilleja foliolosa]|uniref:VQ domain-containing protein n=1 Tax=Castilleja foliolosa TaxID=1961234 RepID=A0ABD3DJU9_9LAMI